jgi:cobalt/nickel transport system permease protein
MHIPDGVLSVPVLAGGAALAAGGVALGLRRLDDARIPKAAVVASALFVASLVHVPVGPSSAHLVLNGLTGIILGWVAFPAVLVALLLQAVFFEFGGLTSLGVNTFNIAAPAVACWALYGRAMRRRGPGAAFALGAAAGATALALSCAAVAASLVGSGREFIPAAQLVAAAHVPVMVIEAAVTGSIAAFLLRVRPELLETSAALRAAAGARDG